tara:strand:- start:112 stop:465 length:354 start_codon:yes stop_codon:yes gene_type:complete
LRDGVCFTHGEQDGDSDVRLRLVLDDGIGSLSLMVNKIAATDLLSMDEEKITKEIEENGSMAFVQQIRELLLGRKMKVSGRTFVDEQGSMLISDDVELLESDSALDASELRTKWELV